MPSFAGDFDRSSDDNAGRSTTRILISVIRKLSDHRGDASLREDERRKLEDNYGVVDDRLKKIVRAKQDGLNRTVDDFQAICSNVHQASVKIRKVKKNLAACKDQIKCKREELKRLHNESAEQSAVLDIFERVDTISHTSSLISALIDGKKYSEAADIVQKVSNDYTTLSDVPVVSGITLPLDIKEHLLSKIINDIDSVLYIQSTSDVKTHRMVKSSQNMKHDGVFGQVHPDLVKTSQVGFSSNQTVKTENFEESLSELIKSLTALNSLKETSKRLEADFPKQIERIFVTSKSEVVTFYSQSECSRENRIELRKVVLSELYELIFLKLTKIVERKNIFVQKMNIAVLQLGKTGGTASTVIYSIADFLEIFQQQMIDILHKFLVEMSKDSSLNSRAGQFYMTPSSNSRSLFAPSVSETQTPEINYVSFSSFTQKGDGYRSKELMSAISSAKAKPDQSRSSGSDSSNFETESLLAPSILNITLIDKPLNKICRYICDQLGCVNKEQCALYVSKEYMINSELFSYLSEKLKRILDERLPKDGIGSIIEASINLASYDSQFPLTEATVIVHEQMAYLADISVNMPNFAPKIESLMAQLLGGFYSRLHQKYIALLSVPQMGNHSSSALKILGARNTKSLMRSTKLWKEILTEATNNTDHDFVSLENNNFVPWSKLNCQILEFCTSNSTNLQSLVAESSETCKILFESLSAVNVSISWLFSQDYGPITDQVANSEKSEISRTIEGLESISETCLFACNVELKVASFSFLSRLFDLKSSPKTLSSVEVHSEVKDLTRIIYEAEVNLTRFLPSKRLAFVFDGLPGFIESIFVMNIEKAGDVAMSSTSFLDRLFLGIVEIKRAFRNVFGVTNEGAGPLDRIVAYFDLLRYPPNDLVRVALEYGFEFAESEWISVLKASAKKFNRFLLESGKIDISGAEFMSLIRQLEPITKRELNKSINISNGTMVSNF